jgi:hypothetical protein
MPLTVIPEGSIEGLDSNEEKVKKRRRLFRRKVKKKYASENAK